MTYIFANDLPQRTSQDAPWEYFDVLFDIPWFRVGKSHDKLEELLAVWLRLGHCRRPKAF